MFNSRNGVVKSGSAKNERGRFYPFILKIETAMKKKSMDYFGFFSYRMINYLPNTFTEETTFT